MLRNDPRCFIRRTIIHNNDFQCPAALIGVRENFLKRGRNTLMLVVSGQYDAVGRFGHESCRLSAATNVDVRILYGEQRLQEIR